MNEFTIHTVFYKSITMDNFYSIWISFSTYEDFAKFLLQYNSDNLTLHSPFGKDIIDISLAHIAFINTSCTLMQKEYNLICGQQIINLYRSLITIKIEVKIKKVLERQIHCIYKSSHILKFRIKQYQAVEICSFNSYITHPISRRRVF